MKTSNMRFVSMISCSSNLHLVKEARPAVSSIGQALLFDISILLTHLTTSDHFFASNDSQKHSHHLKLEKMHSDPQFPPNSEEITPRAFVLFRTPIHP